MKLFFHVSRRFTLVLVGLSLCGTMRGEPTTAVSAALQTLDAAIREAAKDRPKNERANRFEEYDGAGVMMLVQVRSSIATGRSRETERQLEQMTAAATAPVSKAALELLAAIRTENEAKEKAVLTRAESLLADASKVVENARIAADLDGTLQALNSFQGSREDGYDDQRNPAQGKVSAAYRFVTSWQDYLAAIAADDWQKASEGLREASGNTEGKLVARSQILTMLEQVKGKQQAAPRERAREIVQRVRSLDEIDSTLAALRELQNRPGMSGGYNDLGTILQTQLTMIRDGYVHHKEGLPFSVQLRSSLMSNQASNEEADRLLLPLKNQLIRLVVPRFLRVQEPLRASESLDGYLERIRAQAFERFDIRLVARVLELRNKVTSASNQSQIPETLQLLLTAQNQEEASQFFPAVVSYEKVLKLGGELVPAKLIGARLEAIRATHPKEYEAGVQRSVQEVEERRFNYQSPENGPFTILVPGT